MERYRIKARDLAGRARIPFAEAEEALEAVVAPEVAAAERAGELVGEVEIHLAEHGLVVVFADLLRQPERVGVAADFEIGAEPVDLVLLVDVVRLALVEQADDVAEAILARRSQAQLVAGLGVVVLAGDVLRRIDQVARVVVDVGTVAGQRVVPERIVAVVLVGS